MYCKNNQSLLRCWPTTWLGCMNVLKEAGYKEPSTYYVCLDESHPNLWDSMNNPHDVCKYCRKAGTIQYHYLCLTDKVKRWCSSKDFCIKMTQYWKHRENWLHGARDNDDLIYKEFGMVNVLQNLNGFGTLKKNGCCQDTVQLVIRLSTVISSRIYKECSLMKVRQRRQHT